jgi:hypothetical protein
MIQRAPERIRRFPIASHVPHKYAHSTSLQIYIELYTRNKQKFAISRSLAVTVYFRFGQQFSLTISLYKYKMLNSCLLGIADNLETLNSIRWLSLLF